MKTNVGNLKGRVLNLKYDRFIHTFDSDTLRFWHSLAYLVFGLTTVFSVISFMNASDNQGVFGNKYIAFFDRTFLKKWELCIFHFNAKIWEFLFWSSGPLLLLLQARVWKIESFSYINIFHAFSTRRILSYLKMNHNSIIIDVSQIVCNKNVLHHLNLHFCIPKYIC